MSDSLRGPLDFAVDAAWQAGKVTLRYFQTEIQTERKEARSPVTIADREAEARRAEVAARDDGAQRRGGRGEGEVGEARHLGCSLLQRLRCESS